MFFISFRKKVATCAISLGNEKDVAFLKTHLHDFEYLGSMPYDESLIEADLQGISPFEVDCPSKGMIKELINKI